ncbi:unnamed protein product [Cladocopium goreaui]|uniref:30S ribosomal protein S6 n=1 Tax=Cladocopium goreaui TaxID=2562237 RepID=A0A9P1D9U5_9DINO|nr:unnamed protein product [Cladocopium goreaui]
MGMHGDNWRSVRPGKIDWDEQLVATVALDMLNSIPNRALSLIRSSGFMGADLVKTEDDVTRPSFKEIAGNYVWLKPLCHHFKSKVPGGLFLTDVMIYLDVLIGGNLLCKPGVEKVAQAADEAKRLKRLMGALRYLWRNSDSSHSPRVTELKLMLEPSPRCARVQRLARFSDDAIAEAEAERSDDAGEPALLPGGDLANPPASPCRDDDDTLVMGADGGAVPDVANLHDLEEGESGEESEPCVDECVNDSEAEDDVPNIAADSSGNTLHGFNLRALNVGPMPPTPPDEDESEDDSSSSGDDSGDHDGEKASALVTPPPKRHATTVPDESSIKMRKLEKNMKMGGGAGLSKPIAVIEKEPMENVNPKADVKSKKNKNGKKPNPKASFHRRNGRSKASSAGHAERCELPDAGPPGARHDGGPADDMPGDLMYHEYNLTQLGVPRNALPSPNRRHLGKHSYTIEKGGQKIECLLKCKAFYVRGPNKGQVSWNKHGGIVSAWITACGKAGILP